MGFTPPSGSIVILTGAGVSRESGLDTFRDADGVWSKVRIEDVATPEAFARDPAAVHAFYNARRRTLAQDAVQPNPAHHALARLDRLWPGQLLLVTQNVDDLHERAGSLRLLHMHGELRKVRCSGCGTVLEWPGALSVADACPGCGRTGGLRPHVVWFGEMPLGMDTILAALAACDLFVSIGTSGSVYPAAGFVETVRQAGRADTLELNLEPSQISHLFDQVRHGPASELVPALVDELLHLT